jgi:hypothetical protein
MSDDDLSDSKTTAKCASLIARYWAQKGYAVTVDRAGHELVSDMRGGLPRGYRGQDGVPMRSGNKTVALI